MKLVDGERVGEYTTTFKTTLGEILNAYKAGTIIEYSNNRGDRGTSKVRAESLGKIFDASLFGEICLEWTDFPNVFRLICGHHRCYGLWFAYENDLIDDSVLETVVRVKIADKGEGIKLYVGEGRAKGHTQHEKVSNPDTALGYLKLKLFEQVKIPEEFDLDLYKDIFRSQYDGQLLYSIFGVHKYSGTKELERKAMTVVDISSNKKTGLTTYSDYTKEQFIEAKILSKRTEDTVVEALQYVAETICHYIKLSQIGDSKKVSDSAGRLLKQAQFFGLLLWDKINNVEFTQVRPETLARKIKKSEAKILDKVHLFKAQGSSVYEARKELAKRL